MKIPKVYLGGSNQFVISGLKLSLDVFADGDELIGKLRLAVGEKNA